MTGFRNAYDKDPHDKSMRLDSHVDVVRLVSDRRTDGPTDKVECKRMEKKERTTMAATGSLPVFQKKHVPSKNND